MQSSKLLKVLLSVRLNRSQPARQPHFASLVLATLALGLGSCASTPVGSSSDSPASSSSPAASPTAAPVAESQAQPAELQVVTTFLPITQFTKAVAGERAEVIQLLPPNVGPHDYQAKPEDAQKLSQADVLVQNGLEMEEFLEDLVQNASSPNLKIIDSSKGVDLISAEAIEGDQHATAEVTGAAHDHGAKHDHGEFNPHIWLDPKRAIQQVETIRDGLIAADPAGAESYRANAAAYIEKLQSLDREIAAALQPYAGKTFVAFHDFAPYFAESYNLKAEFLVDIPEENPAPADVKRIMDTVQSTQLKTILSEPQAGPDAFSRLAQDLDIQVSQFDSGETGGAAALEPDYYFTLMRQNVKNLQSAFSG